MRNHFFIWCEHTCTDTRKLSWPLRVSVDHVNLHTKQKLFRWRLPVQPDLHFPAPFPFRLSPPFNHHLSYLVNILLYHCLPRGHGGWVTWDQAPQVCFNNIGVPGIYVLRLGLMLNSIKCDILLWNHNTLPHSRYVCVCLCVYNSISFFFFSFGAMHSPSHHLVIPLDYKKIMCQ